MRRITYLLIFLALICLQGCGSSNRKHTNVTREAGTYEHMIFVDSPAETTVETAAVSDSVNKPEGPVEISFRYDQKIDGYTVTGTFTSFSADSETGKIEMHFTNGSDSFVWASGSEDVYTSSSICDICFNKSFTWWQCDSTYSFHYYPPEGEENVDSLHPLGYKTPFQFMDVDFDGKKDLLVSDWSREREGNGYDVYRISGEKASKIDCVPFTEIQTGTKIDPKSKSIEIYITDGYENSVRFLFTKNVSGISEIEFYEFPGSCGKSIYERFAKTWKSSGFILKEFEVLVNGERNRYSLKEGKFVK